MLSIFFETTWVIDVWGNFSLWIMFVVAGMHLFPEEAEKLDGAANFRQVFNDFDFWTISFFNKKKIDVFDKPHGLYEPLTVLVTWYLEYICTHILLFCIYQVNGFPVFGVGQPTEEGFLATLNKASASTWKRLFEEEQCWGWCWLSFQRWPPVRPTLLRSSSGSTSGSEASMFIWSRD